MGYITLTDHKATQLDNYPSKIIVCHCQQCRHAKNDLKNRKLKKKIKRLLNKRRRTTTGKIQLFYWI